MKAFEALTYAGQIRRLRRLAERALGAYGLGGARLAALTNSENMTFRVDALDRERYVLRIHRPNRKSVAAIRSELLWLAALRRDTELVVPDPVPAGDGALVTLAEAPGVPGPRACVLFRWLEGEFAGERLGEEHLVQAGALMARLHQHAAQFTPPAGFTRGRLAQEEFASEAIAPTLRAPGPLFQEQDVQLIPAVHARLRERLAALGEGPDVFGLIHADLHHWNYLFHRGEIRAIDFDDCCWSYYLYDMAVPLLMVYERPDYPALYAAFIRGYRHVRALAAEHEAQLETFMVVRRLILVAWLLGELHNPELRGWAETFVPDSLRAMRAFVEHPS